MAATAFTENGLRLCCSCFLLAVSRTYAKYHHFRSLNAAAPNCGRFLSLRVKLVQVIWGGIILLVCRQVRDFERQAIQ